PIRASPLALSDLRIAAEVLAKRRRRPAQHNIGAATDMNPIETPLKNLVMARRNFLRGATAVGIGTGFSAPAIISPAAANETSEISLRDEDLRFIGTEETFSTHELMVLNDRLFLEDTGLAEIGPRRIGAMDEAGINIQILSAHTPGVQNVPGQEGIDFAYRLNKMIVDGPMATYPGRFRAFATLPLQSPEASADELERAVRKDGFLGC